MSLTELKSAYPKLSVVDVSDQADGCVNLYPPEGMDGIMVLGE